MTRDIIISFVGDATYATERTVDETGIHFRTAEARKSPDDKYDAHEGARVALARLYGVEPFPGKKEKAAKTQSEKREKTAEREWKVGDLVRTKDSLIFPPQNRNRAGVVVKRLEKTLGGRGVYEVKVLSGRRSYVPQNATAYDLEPWDEEKFGKSPFAPKKKKPYIYKPGDKLLYPNGVAGPACMPCRDARFPVKTRVRVVAAIVPCEYQEGDVGTVVGHRRGTIEVHFDHFKNRKACTPCFSTELEVLTDEH